MDTQERNPNDYRAGYAQGVDDSAAAHRPLVDLLTEIVEAKGPETDLLRDDGWLRDDGTDDGVICDDRFVMRLSAALLGADAEVSRLRGNNDAGVE